MSKYKKNEDILSIMSNLQPNSWLKVDFQKLDQHAGGKWLIHDSPAEYPSLVARCDIKRVRWHHVESDILKEGPGAQISWEVRDCRTPNT